MRFPFSISINACLYVIYWPVRQHDLLIPLIRSYIRDPLPLLLPCRAAGSITTPFHSPPATSAGNYYSSYSNSRAEEEADAHTDIQAAARYGTACHDDLHGLDGRGRAVWWFISGNHRAARDAYPVKRWFPRFIYSVINMRLLYIFRLKYSFVVFNIYQCISSSMLFRKCSTPEVDVYCKVHKLACIFFVQRPCVFVFAIKII